MTDNASKISNQVWCWYKKVRGTNKKGAEEWTALIDEARGIISEYGENKDDQKFAMDMFLLFVDRIERLERKENARRRESGE